MICHSSVAFPVLGAVAGSKFKVCMNVKSGAASVRTASSSQIICYCRVSSAKRRGDLSRQVARMRERRPSCGVIHDRNENAAHNLALPGVGEDAMLLGRGALAGGYASAGETAPDERRTKPRTAINTQLRLAL